MRTIYMDANATTQPLPEVLDAMRPYWAESCANPSSVHQRGQQARAAVDQARASVAALLNCRTSEVVFTSGGTESDNLALFGVFGHPGGMLAAGDHLITSAIEHHAVLHAAAALAESGVEVTYLQPTQQGVIEPAALQNALRANTRLVSIMLANNETGVVQPIRELAALVHAHGSAGGGQGTLFHTDAVQAGGKVPLDVRTLGCDLLSLSGHKMHAPQGTGVLFVRRGVNLRPMFFGGLHERGRRPGTENVAGIVGMGKAAELARKWLGNSGAAQEQGTPSSPEALGALRDRLEQGILNTVPDAGVNGFGPERVVNTANLYFDGVDAEALIIALDLQGLAVSAGSACQSGATEPSHVLLAMGIDETRAHASVRFSLSRMNTTSEVERAVEIVAAAVTRQRSIAGAAAPGR
jgi:cysteine desulfurase